MTTLTEDTPTRHTPTEDTLAENAFTKAVRP